MLGLPLHQGEQEYQVASLDRTAQNNSYAFYGGLVLSSLVAAASWPTAPHSGLMAWLLIIWLAQFAHEGYSRRYLKLQDMVSGEYRFWVSGFFFASLATGACWGFSFFLIGFTKSDPAAVLLMFCLAGVTAFVAVARAAMVPVALAFECAAILPMSAWMFLQDDHIYSFMGIIALFYLTMLCLLVRKMHDMLLWNRQLGGENLKLMESRRQHATQLEMSEREFYSLTENLPDNIARWDTEGRYLYINTAHERALGKTLSEVFGHHIPDSHDQVKAAIARTVATGQVVLAMRQKVVVHDVTELHDVRMVPEFDEAGRVISVLGIGRNMTEYYQMQDALAAQELGASEDAAKQHGLEQRLNESRKQLRQLSARRERDLEMERKRIARELHDELGQLLTALQLDFSLLGYELRKRKEKHQERMQSIQNLIDSSLKAARHVATQLRPAALDLGLQTALEWLVRRYSANTDIHCELHIVDYEDHDIDDDCAIALYRITQESLTNAARHAKTNHVTVVLKQLPNALMLSVEDNGVGFDIRNIKAHSFGLLGIRERVMAFGGAVDIDSAPGQGTAVTVRIPLMEKGSNP